MNGFGSLGAGALASALRVNKSLRELDIRNNRVSVAGAAHLGKCCATNGTLEVLKVRYHSASVHKILICDDMKFISAGI